MTRRNAKDQNLVDLFNIARRLRALADEESKGGDQVKMMDALFEDIYGAPAKKLATRILNSENPVEMFEILKSVGYPTLRQIVLNDVYFNVFRDLLGIRDRNAFLKKSYKKLKRDYKKASQRIERAEKLRISPNQPESAIERADKAIEKAKRAKKHASSKVRKHEKEIKYINKMYRKGVKNLRSFIGIKKIENPYKSDYHNLEGFLKSRYRMSSSDDYDFDTFESFFDSMDDDVRTPSMTSSSRFEDYQDYDEDDSEIDDETSERMDKIEDSVEKLEKIMGQILNAIESADSDEDDSDNDYEESDEEESDEIHRMTPRPDPNYEAVLREEPDDEEPVSKQPTLVIPQEPVLHIEGTEDVDNRINIDSPTEWQRKYAVDALANAMNGENKFNPENMKGIKPYSYANEMNMHSPEIDALAEAVQKLRDEIKSMPLNTPECQENLKLYQAMRTKLTELRREQSSMVNELLRNGLTSKDFEKDPSSNSGKNV